MKVGGRGPPECLEDGQDLGRQRRKGMGKMSNGESKRCVEGYVEKVCSQKRSGEGLVEDKWSDVES